MQRQLMTDWQLRFRFAALASAALSVGCIFGGGAQDPAKDRVLCTQTVRCDCSCFLCEQRDSTGGCVQASQRPVNETDRACTAASAPGISTPCDPLLDARVDAGNVPECIDACADSLRNGEAKLDVLYCELKPNGNTVVTSRSCLDQGPERTTALGKANADRVRCSSADSVLTIVERDENGAVLSTSRGPVECEADVSLGSIHLDYLHIYSPSQMRVLGRSLAGVSLTLTNPAVGHASGAGEFVFSPSDLRFTGSALVDGRYDAAVGITPTATPTVRYDRASGAFVASLALATPGARTSMTLSLSGAAMSRAPTARFDAPAEVECIAGGGRVQLDGSNSSDPDGEALSFYWTVDGAAAATGPSFDANLTPGAHAIRLTVFDSRGMGTSERVISVVDTQPPVITDIPARACLWPPNHEMYKFVASVATDACDGPVPVTIVEAISSQSDDDIGDGSTTLDVLRHGNTVCARAERAGSVKTGRSYAIRASAVDSSGLEGAVSFELVTPHDQSPANRCTVTSAISPVVDFDSECLAPALAETGSAELPRGEVGQPAAGCHAGAFDLQTFGIIGVLIASIQRRRRSS